MSKKGTKWSPAEINAVRDMHIAGRSDNEIGEALGRSGTGVQHIRISLGIRREAHRKFIPVPPTYETNSRACRLHLIDLMQCYASPKDTLGSAKALYRKRNELDVPKGYNPRVFNPWRETISMVGSHFADVPR